MARLSCMFEQTDELRQLGGAHVAEQLDGQLLNVRVHGGKQFEAGVGDLRPDDAAVVAVATLLDELERLEPAEQAGDVGLGGDHAVADGGAGEPLGMCAAEDAEDVVLGRGDAPVTKSEMKGALQGVGGAHQVENGFFFHA